MNNFLLADQDYQVWPKSFQIFCPQHHIPYWDRLLWDTFLSLSSTSSNPNRLPPSLSKKQDWVDLKIIINESWLMNRESWIITWWFIFCIWSGVFPMVAVSLQPHAEFRKNDHWEDAVYFEQRIWVISYNISGSYPVNIVIWDHSKRLKYYDSPNSTAFW